MKISVRQTLVYPLSVLFFLGACFPSAAQMGYGPELGVGMSSMYFAPDIGFTSASQRPIASGRVGGNIDSRLSKTRLYVQAGLFLSRKGQSRNFSFYTSDSLNAAVKQTLTINYIDLPVNILFKTGIQGKGRFFLGLGATASYILGGRNQFHDQGAYNDTPFVKDVNTRIVNGNPLKLFDMGMNITGGYELPTGLYFRAYYTAGINDLGLGREIDKNRMWGIGAGYFFGKGRNINQEADDLIDKTE